MPGPCTAARLGVARIDVFAPGVVVKHQHLQVGTFSAVGILQHLDVAVGVAERGDRATADVLIDADRFAGFVVNEVDFRQAHEHRRPVTQLEFRLDTAADDLLKWNPIDPFGPGAHEFDAAAGEYEGLKAIGAQIPRFHTISSISCL